MDDTPNHGYRRPEEGKEDWHIDLNDNFSQIDSDIEIRDPEANKGDYEPKKGAKYEATDSGAVYLGNGDTWVLVDRKVGSLNTKSISTGEIFKTDQSSTAIISPSVSGAYDTIQAAINDGHNDIVVAEDIIENNIVIKRDGIQICGWGNDRQRVITDPQDGNPVFRIPSDVGSIKWVRIANLKTVGGDNSGPVIQGVNLDASDGSYTGAQLWEIYNCNFRSGPIFLNGPRNQLRHVTCANSSSNDVTLPWNGYTTKAALIIDGATFGIMGGSYSNKNKGTEAAYISGGAGTITGGVTFTNAYDAPSGSRDILFQGCSRIFCGPMSMESSKEYNMQFGASELSDTPGPGLASAVLAAPSMNPHESGPDEGFSKIKIGDTSSNILILMPHTKVKVEKEAPGDVTIVGPNPVRATGYLPFEVNHIQLGSPPGQVRIGGDRDAPVTQTGIQIQSSPPDYPRTGSMLIADGSNWDPDGDGKAELVMYNGSSWVEVADLHDTL